VEKKRSLAIDPVQKISYYGKIRLLPRVPNALHQVANFHLRNGAQLYQINWLADLSTKRMKQSYGLMVNYKYNLDELRQNNEDYLLRNTINTSSAVKSLLQ
jgi:malonyl-CoA decarboxylase